MEIKTKFDMLYNFFTWLLYHTVTAISSVRLRYVAPGMVVLQLGARPIELEQGASSKTLDEKPSAT